MKNYFERTIRIAALTGLVALVGCSKDDPAPFMEAELTSGSGEWKLTALTITASGQSGDALEDFEECEKDNIFYFNDDGTYEVRAGATQCDVSEPNIIESGTWEIDGKNLTIEITGDEPETVEIKLLSATTLKTRLAFDFFGVTAVINSTYTKQ